MLFLEVKKNDKVEIQNEFGKRCPIKHNIKHNSASNQSGIFERHEN